MKSNIVGRIYVENGTRQIYSDLGRKLGYGFHHTDVFTLAMSYGYINQIKIPLTRKEALFRTVSARDDFYSLMLMLYINEKKEVPVNLEENISEAIHIAEEYANGGLKLLADDIYNDMGNFPNKLASKILKLDGENNIRKNLSDLGIE